MATVIRTGPAPAFASETLTVSTTAVVLTAATYRTYDSTNQIRRWAAQATITIEDAAIRVTFYGTTPVDATDIGHVFSAGTVLTLESQTQIERFKAVRNGGTNAVINVTYWEG